MAKSVLTNGAFCGFCGSFEFQVFGLKMFCRCGAVGKRIREAEKTWLVGYDVKWDRCDTGDSVRVVEFRNGVFYDGEE